MNDMLEKEVIEKIRTLKLIPVVVLDDAKDAIPLAKAICEGGLPCAEVTFRTNAASESIRQMKENYPQMLIGAGTVLTKEQVDEAVEAGAEFIVSPGLNPDIVSYCVEKKIPIIPGCANPSDIEQALKYGLHTVKFFPAEALGGLKLIRALSAPYVGVNFMPTGGINSSNIKEYLACDSVIACGGTWMIPKTAIENGDFEQIRNLTAAAVELISK